MPLPSLGFLQRCARHGVNLHKLRLTSCFLQLPSVISKDFLGTCLPCAFKKMNRLYTWAVLGLQENEVPPVNFHIPPTAYPLDALFLLYNILHSEAHLLQLMSQYWYIVINESSEFTLRFTHCVVNSMSFDKYVMACIHHYNIMCNRLSSQRKLSFWSPVIYLFLIKTHVGRGDRSLCMQQKYPYGKTHPADVLWKQEESSLSDPFFS